MNKRQLKEQRNVYKADAEKYKTKWYNEVDVSNTLLMKKNATISSLNDTIDILEAKNVGTEVTYLAEMQVTTRDEDGNAVVEVLVDYQSKELELIRHWAKGWRVENEDAVLVITEQRTRKVDSNGNVTPKPYYPRSSYYDAIFGTYPRTYNYRY